MQRILIADSDQDFCTLLASELREQYEVAVCFDGISALNMLRDSSPDLLVLDILLPEIDGISLLEALTAMDHRPTVLATSRFLSDYLMQRISQLSVGYLMMKPCHVKALCSRIKELTCEYPATAVSSVDPRERISSLLISLGISTKLKGFACLREAILLLTEDPAQSITKELYPAVAKRMSSGATGQQVERLMRSAIESAWERRDIAQWEIYFPENARLFRPSNRTFLSRLAETMIGKA